MFCVVESGNNHEKNLVGRLDFGKCTLHCRKFESFPETLKLVLFFSSKCAGIPQPIMTQASRRNQYEQGHEEVNEKNVLYCYVRYRN